MTRKPSTYGMPGSRGADDFRAKQEPQFEPVDDLSRFVLDRIREAESEPVADQVEPNGHPMGYRYAKHVRDDMIPYRRIAAEYCAAVTEVAHQSAADEAWAESNQAHWWSGYLEGMKGSMTAVANRWDDHHDFEKGWLIDG